LFPFFSYLTKWFAPPPTPPSSWACPRLSFLAKVLLNRVESFCWRLISCPWIRRPPPVLELAVCPLATLLMFSHPECGMCPELVFGTDVYVFFAFYSRKPQCQICGLELGFYIPPPPMVYSTPLDSFVPPRFFLSFKPHHNASCGYQ